MSQSENMGDLMTRVELGWDPDRFKELLAGLYDHLSRALDYYPNEDGVYQPECPNRTCPYNTLECWDEFAAFFIARELHWQTVKQLIENEFKPMPGCQRELIFRYSLKELFQEIDYRREGHLKKGE